MVRRYRRSYRSNRDKYSVENTCVITPAPIDWPVVEGGERTQQSSQFTVQVVPSADVEGMRKVKHLTLSFSAQSDIKILYALVYVPSGYQPNSISVPIAGEAISLYEPNQYVMASGCLDFTGGPLRVRTPLARNLNSGDALALVLATESSGTGGIAINIQYAITLQ